MAAGGWSARAASAGVISEPTSNTSQVKLRSSIGYKIGFGVTITVLVLIVIGVVSTLTVHSQLKDIERVAAGEQLLRAMTDLEASLTRAESAALTFALTGDPLALRGFESTEPEQKDALEEVEAALGTEEHLLVQLPALRRYCTERMGRLTQIMQIAREKGHGDIAKLLVDNQDRQVLDRFYESVNTLRIAQQAELRLLRKQVDGRKNQTYVTLGVEALVAVLMIYTMGRAVVNDLTIPLQRLVAGITQIGEGRLDYRVEISSSDEIGQLGRAFNRMAEQLQQGRGLRLNAEEALQATNAKLADRVEALRRKNLEIEEMSRLTELLQTAVRAEEAYQVVASFGERVFPDTCGTLLLTTPSRTLLEAVTSWGEPRSERMFSPEDCWALRRGRAHPAVEPGALHCHHYHEDDQPGNELCIPLVAQGEALGVLCLEGAVIDEQLAITVSEQLSLALANLRLRETLRNQSIRDGLTGLFNRRYLEASLDRELHRSMRNEQPMGVLMIDIDHFKAFNDNFGHDAGDAVLQALGVLLKNSVRAEDIPCRFGGEEFAVLLPGASLEVARERAEKLRAAAQGLSVTSGGRPVGPVSLSIGVAAFPYHGQDGNEVIKVADEALYRAKRAGRNQVQVGLEVAEPAAKA